VRLKTWSVPPTMLFAVTLEPERSWTAVEPL
jgi:hypothetical protein